MEQLGFYREVELLTTGRAPDGLGGWTTTQETTKTLYGRVWAPAAKELKALDIEFNLYLLLPFGTSLPSSSNVRVDGRVYKVGRQTAFGGRSLVMLHE